MSAEGEIATRRAAAARLYHEGWKQVDISEKLGVSRATIHADLKATGRLDSPAPHVSWPELLRRADEIVRSYDTGVTLRQCFYRLVAEGALPNTRNYYNSLSRYSAEARRDGWFASFIDETTSIHNGWRGGDGNQDEALASALEDAVRYFSLDNLEGQEWAVYIGAEKRGLVEQLKSWFRHLPVPILPVGGWASQTYCDEVRALVLRRGLPAVLAYVGDFDPSGVFIDEDFVRRVGVFKEVVRVGLTLQQVEELADQGMNNPLPEEKKDDPRVPRFIREYGPQLESIGLDPVVQFEVDALPPDQLRNEMTGAVDEFFDHDAHQDVLDREEEQRDQLRARVEEVAEVLGVEVDLEGDA